MSNDSGKRKPNDRRFQILEYIDLYVKEYGFSPTAREISEHLNISGTGDVHFNIERMEDDGWITTIKTANGSRKAGTIRLTEEGKNQLLSYQQQRLHGDPSAPSIPQEPELTPIPMPVPVQEELPNNSSNRVDPVSPEQQNPQAAPGGDGTDGSMPPQKRPIHEVSEVILSARISNRRAIRTVNIPVLNIIAASFGMEQESSDFSLSAFDAESYLNINLDMVNRYRTQDLFALEVRGNSMIDAGIREGDYVILKKTQTAENGDMCAVWIDGKEATLKYFYREEKRVRLEAANPSVPPRYIGPSHAVAIQGKVILVVRL